MAFEIESGATVGSAGFVNYSILPYSFLSVYLFEYVYLILKKILILSYFILSIISYLIYIFIYFSVYIYVYVPLLFSFLLQQHSRIFFLQT